MVVCAELCGVNDFSAHVKHYYLRLLHKKKTTKKFRKKRAEKLNNYVQLNGITRRTTDTRAYGMNQCARARCLFYSFLLFFYSCFFFRVSLYLLNIPVNVFVNMKSEHET